VELGLAGGAAGFLEEDVVVGVGVEGQVEINEVNARVGEDVFVPRPFQVIAEEQAVHAARCRQIGRQRQRRGTFWTRRLGES
jgi:hypothetical protein